MKILLIPSATPHAPLSHTPIALGRELMKRGHSLSMMAPSFDKYSKWKVDRPADMHGIPVAYPFQFRTRSQIVNLMPYMLHAAALVLLRKVDVIYIYKPTPISAVGVLGKLRGAKVIFHTDDLDAEVMKAQGQPRLLSGLVDVAERIIARYADALVGASRLLQREYTARFPKKPFLRLPNGVDAKEFPVAPTAGPGRQVKIIFFGILGRTKILAPVLEAMPRVIRDLGPDAVSVEVLGDGPCLPELREMTEKLGIEAQVNFRGWTTYDQLQSYAVASDIGICIMPNERTTAACSNQKVFQYMSLGLATIVSAVGDLPLYVQDGKAGVVVPPDDQEALVKVIERLVKNPALRQQLAAEGRRQAETTFAWSTLARQVEQLINEA